MKQKKNDVFTLTLTALFAALMVAGTYIRIPLGPVPVVLTTLFVIASGAILGPAGGTGAVFLYLVLGALGLPVFSQGGGLALFAGPTGGFLIGYLAGAFTAGIIVKTGKSSRIRDLLGILAGTLIIYLPGLPWLSRALDFGLRRTLTVGFLPFLPGDLLKALVVFLLLQRLRLSLPEFFAQKGEKVPEVSPEEPAE